MEQSRVKELELLATRARLLGLKAVHDCASGHIGGSLSAMDILTVLYFETLKVDPKDSKNPGRDRFVLSKGHCTPALYPVLALRGFFPVEDLKLFRSIEGHLSGHAEMRHVNGVDMSTGSLGQGLSAAVGMAVAGKLDRKDYRVYALMGALVAVTAAIQIARIGSMDYANAGSGYEMDAIAAVIIGGTSMSGGRGSVIGSVLGMLILAVMNNLLNLIGVPPFLREAFKGIIVIGAVLLQKKEKAS